MFDPSAKRPVGPAGRKMFWFFVKFISVVAALFAAIGMVVVAAAWSYRLAPVLVVALVIFGFFYYADKAVPPDEQEQERPGD